MKKDRQRLDNTLAMPDLVNEESINSLVKEQLLRSSISANEEDIGKVVENRTVEVSNFLEMLRSASANAKEPIKAGPTVHNDWKLKQDTDQLRVMYREGPHGTPFHTLLAEGYADGPIDVCLCVSWEASLYKKWWPQYNIPTFKITMASCLQKVGIGEEISLIRMKVPWPVSDREALLHYFEIEYFKEDLIIVLLKTISDTEHVDVKTHGFTRDGIPKAKETVRVDLVGGFVLQKVDRNRSYFRAIANMDIKLDFVPPWLINFISRQLIGNGHKLYQKAVGSVATSDQDYRRALEGPMYAQIREALDSHNEPKLDLIDSAKEKPTIPREEHKDDNTPPSIKATTFSEIVEEETESNQCLKGKHIMNGSSGNQIITGQENVLKERVFISAEVERALRTLDQAIAIVRGDRSSVDHSVTKASPISDRGDDRNSSSRDNKPANAAHHSSSVGHFSNGDSALREAKHEQRDTPTRLSVSHEKPSAAAVGMVQPPAVESMRKVCVEERLMANGFNSGDPYGGKPRDKQKVKRDTVCCFGMGLRGGED